MKLRDRLIKLAYENPELREDLLPLLKEARLLSMRDFMRAVSDVLDADISEARGTFSPGLWATGPFDKQEFNRAMKSLMMRKTGPASWETQDGSLFAEYWEEGTAYLMDRDKTASKTSADPNEQAYNLVQNDRELTRQLDKLVGNVGDALKGAQKQLKSLERAGSEKLAAPSVLAGRPLDELQSLQNFVDRVIKQIKELEPHGR